MGVRVHHTALIVADVETSLRFYRDGLGLAMMMDTEFDGEWAKLFGARSDRLRSVFLGDPEDGAAGIVELVTFSGGADAAAAPGAPANGFFLLSFNVDVRATVERLGRLGFGGTRSIDVHSPRGPVAMVTLRDPDGVLVELIDLPDGTVATMTQQS